MQLAQAIRTALVDVSAYKMQHAVLRVRFSLGIYNDILMTFPKTHNDKLMTYRMTYFLHNDKFIR